MPGWTLFRGAVRQRFFDEVGLDDATDPGAKVGRARGGGSSDCTITTRDRTCRRTRVFSIEGVCCALSVEAAAHS